VEEKDKVTAEEIGTEKPKKAKKNKKDEEIEALEAKLAAEHDLLLRTAAEFDNFKKRTERERIQTAEYSKAAILKKLLPIIDNIDRAALAESGSAEYIKGIELIIKQFSTLSNDLGLVPLATKGDKFDPNLHEAVMHCEDEAFGENEIAEVLQQGYKVGDTVVRAAMVKVAN
jgi:molecular chaperone GrpE